MMKKIVNVIDFFVNRYYFKTLNEYNSFQVHDTLIKQIKFFQNDKIICISNDNDVLIYNIIKKNLLFQMFNKKGYQKKIKIYKNDKFILYDTDYYNTKNYKIKLYKFIENKEENEYYCKELSTISEKANNLFIKRKNIICIKNGYINIYNIINDTFFQTQVKIVIPHLISNYSYFKGFIMKKKELKIVEYEKENIELWSFENYKLKYKNQINILENNYMNSDLIIASLNNKDYILFSISDFIYLYSYNNEYIIKKIRLSSINKCYNEYMNILGIYITKKDEIYLNNKIKIYLLNLECETVNPITRLNYHFNNSFVYKENKDNNIFIANSNDKIIFFKPSLYSTVIQDLKYFWILFFFIYAYFYITINKVESISLVAKCSGVIFYFWKIFGLFSTIENWINDKRNNLLKILIIIEIIFIIINLYV